MYHILKHTKAIFSFLTIFLLISGSAFGQTLTKVKGKVLDAETGEGLPFVNVVFVGTTVGATTDFDGVYEIETQWGSDKITASYVGYEPDTLDVILGKRQTINFELSSGSTTLKEITIKAKKRRYRRRGNPAVAFVKRAIKNKQNNRLESKDFYEYKKYEKLQLDINNITDKFRESRIFKNFQFMFENVDTSEINGKPYLPIYIQETNSRKYFRKNPKTARTYRDAVKISNIEELADDQTVSQFMNLLNQRVDIYENNIEIVGISFVSPLSSVAPFFYHFYINDTTEVNNIKCIDLAFQPANKQNFGFKGNLYISLDSAYTVLKVDMGITEQINLNWISDLRVTQEFSKVPDHDVWVVSQDDLVLDFQITKRGFGFFGRKSTVYSDLLINQEPDRSVWDPVMKKIDAKDVFEKPDDYWIQNRPVALSTQEENIYKMVDTLQTIKAFNNSTYLLNFFATGYLPAGPFDIGPVNSFYGFNSVEGTRIRFGGETNFKFSKKLRLQGQLLYATLDERWKYSTQLTYTFNDDYEKNPRHQLLFKHQHDTNFPGQLLEHINENNFLLSFKRGVADKMIFFTSSSLEYWHEMGNDFAYKFRFEQRKERPIGTLFFKNQEDQVETFIPDINTTEVFAQLRWAPNEVYLQGRNYRTNLFNKHPIFTLDYTYGIPELFQSDYDYHKIKLNIFKRFNFSFLGIAHVYLEGGKIFGEVPFNLMFLPRANQTYSLQTHSYNMMNFLEFVSDQYVSLNAIYYMNGYLFNKVPLMRRLKWREVLSFKLLYGSVTDKNNPSLHPELIQFPTDLDGNPTTFTLVNEPYIEGSVGISNIFRFFSINVVKRFNYLDNPNVPELFGVKGLGLRMWIGLEF